MKYKTMTNTSKTHKFIIAVLHCHNRNLNKAIASIGIPAHFDIIILCYCFNTKEFCEINNENNNLFFYQILMNVQVTMADVHSHV